MKQKKTTLLSVNHLSVAFPTSAGGEKTVVDRISFSLKEGEILGIAGESGSGKSMTALAVMGLLPESARRRCESIVFDGVQLCGDAAMSGEQAKTEREKKKKEEQLRQELSGSKMTMIFQEPLTSLNPVLTIKKQMEEPLLLHKLCRTTL